MVGSLVSLIYNTLEWNRVGKQSSSFWLEIKTRIQAFPIYAICSIYKSLSLATMVAILRWYAVIPILMLLSSLEILACILLKTTEGIKHYRQSQRFYIVFSLTTMALPGSLINENVENKEWIRWESRISSLIHSMVLLALTLIWENTTVLYISVCTDDSMNVNLPYIMIGIVLLSALHVVATELYLRWLPDLCWLGLKGDHEYDEKALEEFNKIKMKILSDVDEDEKSTYRNQNDLTISNFVLVCSYI